MINFFITSSGLKTEHNNFQLKSFCMCSQSARQPEPINMQADEETETCELSTHRNVGATGSKRTWEYDVPDISIMGVEDNQMPEMPNLQSDLGNALQTVILFFFKPQVKFTAISQLVFERLVKNILVI